MNKNKILAILISIIIFIVALHFYFDARENITPKSVSVKGYYRNDGTYVRPYKRRPPYSVPHDEPYENIISLTIIIMLGCCIVTGSSIYLIYNNSKRKSTNNNFRNYSFQNPVITVKGVPPDLAPENNSEMLIKTAMEKDLLVSFDYTDNKGIKSKRIIRPERFTYSYNDKTCIEGFCFLRKGKRHFALTKIINVTLINKK